MAEQDDNVTVTYTEHPVYAALNEFLHSHFTKRNVADTLSCLSDQLYSIGTGEHELATTKASFSHLLEAEFSQTSNPIRFQISDYVQKERVPGCWDCLCRIQAQTSLPTGEQATYQMRLTAGIHQEGPRYLIDLLHISEASRCQNEPEFFPLKVISRGTEALNRRTRYELMELIGQIMPGGIVGSYMEEGFPLYVANERFLRMVGYDSYRDFEAGIQGRFINSIYEEDREYLIREMSKLLVPGDQYEIRYRMNKKDGSFLWVHDLGRKTLASNGRSAIISVLTDISQQVRSMISLEKAAVSDPLTGIYNRKGGQIRIAQAMDRVSGYTFFMIDLDHFKRINDLYGHKEGDQVLCFVAEQLTKQFRKTDVACRLGGDEFAVFMGDCEEKEVMEEKLSHLIDSYRKKIEECWPNTSSGMSIGGVCGREKRSFSELYQLADDILYEVKHSKKGSFKLCSLP